MGTAVCFVCPQMPQKKNFSWLLFALIGYLILVPVAEDMGVISARLMRVIMFSWLFAFGVWSLRGFGTYFHTGISLALVGIALSVIAANTTTVGYFYASFAALYGFMLIIIWCLAHLQAFPSRSTRAGAASGYTSVSSR
jgi:hypothetical protein